MKLLTATLALIAGASIANAMLVLVPNGDFETPNGDSWRIAESGVGVATFPATDGNGGGGYGRLDATAGAWGGVLVQEGGSGPASAPEVNLLSLSSMGLIAGNTYTFQWDQIDLAGNGKVAGIKIESWDTGLIGDSGDILVATTDQWTTETASYTIDPAATHFKYVLVENQGDGIAGFDNVGVIVVPEPTSTVLVGLGAFALLGFRRRK